MVQDPHDFFGPLRDFSLDNEERSAVWAALREEQEACAYFTPARSDALTASEKSLLLADLKRSAIAMAAPSRRASWGEIRDFLSARFFAPVCAAVLLIGGGAGITYAAEYALPGQFLYRIKLLNENIRSGLQFSHESRAAAETDRVGRRLREAETLLEKQKLTESVSLTLDHEFRLERRRASAHILLLEESGNVEAAARTRARLNALEDKYERLIGINHQGEEESASAASSNAGNSAVISSFSAQTTSSQANAASSTSTTLSSSSAGGSLRIESRLSASVASNIEGAVDGVAKTVKEVSETIEETVKGAWQSVTVKQTNSVNVDVNVTH